MNQPTSLPPKSPTSHLHVVNLIVALLAGIVSITGGIYTLKSNMFAKPAYGSLEGIVRDEKIAKPLVLASVEVSGLDGAVVNTVETDKTGHYFVETLKEGNYVVKFSAPLHVVQTKNIKIEKDLKTAINVDLVPEANLPQSTAAERMSAVRTRQVSQPFYSGTPVPQPSSVSGVSTQTVLTNYQQPSGQVLSDTSTFPRRPSFHRRGFRNTYDSSNAPAALSSSSSSGTSQNTLAQAGAQLLQQLLVKKSDTNQTSGS